MSPEPEQPGAIALAVQEKRERDPMVPRKFPDCLSILTQVHADHLKPLAAELPVQRGLCGSLP